MEELIGEILSAAERLRQRVEETYVRSEEILRCGGSAPAGVRAAEEVPSDVARAQLAEAASQRAQLAEDVETYREALREMLLRCRDVTQSVVRSAEALQQAQAREIAELTGLLRGLVSENRELKGRLLLAEDTIRAAAEVPDDGLMEQYLANLERENAALRTVLLLQDDPEDVPSSS